MKRMVDKILQQYGTEVTLQGSSGERTVRCFFQPVNSTSWQSIESVASPLGEITRGQYTYVGPTDVALVEGDTLILGARDYLIRRVEPYYYSGQAVYIWGLCVEKGVNDTWGSQS